MSQMERNQSGLEEVVRRYLAADEQGRASMLAWFDEGGATRPPAEVLPLLLTIQAAAKLVGCSRATVSRAIAAGRLQKVEIRDNAFRLRTADVHAWANGQPSPRMDQGGVSVHGTGRHGQSLRGGAHGR